MDSPRPAARIAALPVEPERGDHRVHSHEFVISLLTRAYTLLGEGLLTPSSNEGVSVHANHASNVSGVGRSSTVRVLVTIPVPR